MKTLLLSFIWTSIALPAFCGSPTVEGVHPIDDRTFAVLMEQYLEAEGHSPELLGFPNAVAPDPYHGFERLCILFDRLKARPVQDLGIRAEQLLEIANQAIYFNGQKGARLYAELSDWLFKHPAALRTVHSDFGSSFFSLTVSSEMNDAVVQMQKTKLELWSRMALSGQKDLQMFAAQNAIFLDSGEGVRIDTLLRLTQSNEARIVLAAWRSLAVMLPSERRNDIVVSFARKSWEKWDRVVEIRLQLYELLQNETDLNFADYFSDCKNAEALRIAIDLTPHYSGDKSAHLKKVLHSLIQTEEGSLSFRVLKTAFNNLEQAHLVEKKRFDQAVGLISFRKPDTSVTLYTAYSRWFALAKEYFETGDSVYSTILVHEERHPCAVANLIESSEVLGADGDALLMRVMDSQDLILQNAVARRISSLPNLESDLLSEFFVRAPEYGQIEFCRLLFLRGERPLGDSQVREVLHKIMKDSSVVVQREALQSIIYRRNSSAYQTDADQRDQESLKLLAGVAGNIESFTRIWLLKGPLRHARRFRSIVEAFAQDSDATVRKNATDVLDYFDSIAHFSSPLP